MLIAAEVQRVPAHVWGKPAPIKLADLRIPFEFKRVEAGGKADEDRPVDWELEKKRAAAASKARSLARVGMLEDDR